MELTGADFGLARLPPDAQARAPAARGLVQDARRLHQSADARRSRPRAWSRPRAATTARRSPTRRMRLGVPGAHLRAHRVLAGQDQPHPRLRRRPRGGRRSLRRRAGREPGVGGAARAPCRCTPSTRRRRCSARARSASSWREQAPDLDTLLVAVGGGGLIGGIAAWYAGRIARDRRRARRRADAHRGARGGRAGGRAGRRHRRRLARPAAGGRADVPDRAGARRAGRAGDRRGHPAGAAGALGQRCGWSPSPAAPPPSRRCSAAPTCRPRASGSASW